MTGLLSLAELSFTRPGFLWLLPVPLVLLARRAPALAVLGAPLRWAPGPLTSRAGRASWYGTRWLCAAAAGLLLLAAAGPVRRMPAAVAPAAGAAVMAVLDVSASMTGGVPAPMAVARSSLLQLVRRRPDVRLGLVTFAGSALTRLPPTADTRLVEWALETAPAGVREDGTALGTAVGLAVERLAAVEARERVVVVLSDGMHNAGAVGPVTAAALARADGTRVHAVLLEGAPEGGRALLEEVVRAGGGTVFTSAADADSLLARLEALAPLQGSSPAWRASPAWQAPVLASLLLLVATILLHLWRPDPRRWRPAAVPAAAGALVLAGWALPVARATGDAEPPTGPGLLRVAVDVSRSMAVETGGRSRFDRGRAALRELLARVPGVRVELAVFGRGAHTLVPPTRGVDVVLRYLDALEPGLLSREGTGRDALVEWLASAPADARAGEQVLAVVVTDGEWPSGGDPLPGPLPEAHVLWTGLPREGPVPGVPGGISTAHRDGPDLLSRETRGRTIPVEDGPALASLARRLAPPGTSLEPTPDGTRLPRQASPPTPPFSAAVAGFLLSLSLWLRGGRP